MTNRLFAASFIALLALAAPGVGVAAPEAAEKPAAAETPDEPVAILPDLSLPDMVTGEAVSLAQTGGRVVLLDFWATWCSPCTKSLPVYETLQTELGSRGFAVIAVSVDEPDAPIAEFAARLAPSVQVLLDPKGTAPKAMDLPGLPTAYLVGRDGVVRSRHVGFHTKDVAAFKAEIETLLAEPAPEAPAAQ